MNWRAIGCGTLAAAAFVLLGILAIGRAFGPTACPSSIELPAGSYRSVGDASDAPRIAGSDAELVPAGSAGIGFATWEIWAASAPDPDAEDPTALPDEIALGCGDGTFQPYQRSDS